MAYANVWFYGCFLVIVPMVGNSLIRATGDTRLPGYVMFMIAIVNIILNPIFIFGWGFIPAMGIQGAAVASLLAYSAAFVFALYMLCVRLGFLQLSSVWVNPIALWRSLLHIAYPSVLTNLMVPISVGITTAYVAVYGEVALAGLSVAMRIEAFAMVPVFALASVMGPFVGQNNGAGRVDRTDAALLWTNKVMLTYGLVIYSSILLLGPWIVEVFDITAAVQDQANLYLRTVTWCYGFLGIAVVTNSCANALARPMIALVINLARLFVFYLPLLWLFEYFYGVVGVYAAISVATAATALIAWFLRRWL